MKDLTIEILTATATYAIVTVCVYTLPLTLFTLITLFNGKTTYGNAFFTFYKIGLATDMLAILASLLFGIAPSLGWFVEEFTATDVPLKLFYFFNWFTRVMQGFTNTFICLNRATATLVPLMHSKIWKPPFVIRTLIFAQFLASITLGTLNARHEAHWRIYPDGRAFIVKTENEGAHRQYFAGFILLSVNILVMLFLYTIIFIRLKISESSLSKKYSSKDNKARSLLWIAVVVISLEMMYCAYFYFALVDDSTENKDLRVFMTKYFIVTEAYAVLPTYILLVFSGSVRKEMRICFNDMIIN